MTNRMYAVTALSAALFLAACSGDDGQDGVDGVDGADGSDGFNSLIAVRTVPVGDAVCIGGGQAVDSGLDTNRNDILDPDEVTATEYLECAVTPTLRALHASPDAPAVNIWVDGAAALTDVDFNQGSGQLPVGQGDNVTENGVNVNVQIEAILPGTTAVVFDETLELPFGTETTVIASGTIGGGDFGPIAITNPIGEEIAAGSFRAQVVHASPSAPAVDVYVTAPGGALDAPINALPLAFGQSTDRLEVPEGTYQIRVAVPDAAGPIVVYDSGSVDLPAGADLMIAATENVFLGDSAVQLIVLDPAAANPLLDTNTPAGALPVHLGPDAPAVDILADVGSTAEIESILLAQNVAYTEFCSLSSIGAPETYTLSVVATGDTTSVLDIPYTAAPNEATTVIVSGLLGTDTLTAIPLGIDGRSVATEAKVRITHGSPSTPNVDLYILPEGTMIGDEGVAPAFTDVPFGADTGVLSVDPAQNLDIYVTATGDTTPAISVTGFNPEPGMVLDVVARDATGMEMGPQVLVIDYDNLTECAVAP